MSPSWISTSTAKQKDHQNCQSRAKHDNRLPQALLQPVYIGRNTDKIGLVIAQIEAGQQGLVRVSLPRFLVSKFQIAIHPAGKNPPDLNIGHVFWNRQMDDWIPNLVGFFQIIIPRETPSPLQANYSSII